MNPALMSSRRQDWRTPKVVLDLVRQVGPIALDPCTDSDNPTGALMFATTNGLSLPWHSSKPFGGGLVFCNPPYSRSLRDWSEKCVMEANLGAEIIALVPARTDTMWWSVMTVANAFCFWRGRLRFEGAPASAPFPSALVYFGRRTFLFGRVFGPYGWVVK